MVRFTAGLGNGNKTMSDGKEIYIDPYDGRTVPCVMCAASPQLVGTGVCSDACEDALNKWIEEDMK